MFSRLSTRFCGRLLVPPQTHTLIQQPLVKSLAPSHGFRGLIFIRSENKFLQQGHISARGFISGPSRVVPALRTIRTMQNTNHFARRATIFNSTLKSPSLFNRRQLSQSSTAGNLVSWYNAHLAATPLKTTALSTCIIMSAGDIFCQLAIEGGSISSFDVMRTARMTIIGLAMVGPTLHYWYGYLHRRFPGIAARTVALRVAGDQFLFAPIFLAAILAAIFTLSGIPDSYPDHMRNNYVEALVVNWGIWIPVQFINFRFIPAQHAVLFANFVALFWNSYLSWSAHREGH